MKNKFLKYFFAFTIGVLALACSTKRNSFVNRSYHSVSTKYNVLYNGDLAFDKGVEELKLTYRDNFWEILPVERMQDKNEVILPGQTKNADFDRAETKAIKAIQKHAMYIDGGEKNPQIDEAHLLLGKARYYDNRFLPALEAFNYILYKYPTSDKIHEAKVWREKTNIRLENEAQAIKNLKLLLKNNQLKGQVKADANAILAQAYLNTGSKDSAIARLKIAHELTSYQEEEARYSFILGQLYENLGYKDSAYAAFQKVIEMKRKSPRRYVIWAHAKQAQQFDYTNGDTLAFVEKYNDLLKDRENRPYLDVINHQMGVYYDKKNKNIPAKRYYNKSLRSPSQDNYLMATNYKNLAAIAFEEARYVQAGKYYDSTMLRMDNKSREFFAIKKKRENLSDVIKYETIIQTNDSILKLAGMTENERKIYFEDYISKLKKEDELKALAASKELEKKQNTIGKESDSNVLGNSMINGGKTDPVQNNNAMMPPSMMPPQVQQSSSIGNQSNFYFYNPTTVALGKTEFKKKWGNRPYKENWRWSSQENDKIETEEISALDEEKDNKSEQNPLLVADKPQYTADFYLNRLPSDPNVLDSLKRERNFAYFQLGTIYKEKFKEYELAASKLEKLLVSQPEERLVLPAKYNLYKIYQQIDASKAANIKNQIIAEYPNSHYAQILSNPDSEIVAENDSPAKVFQKLYNLYENGNYHEALDLTEQKMNVFSSDEIAPKLEMLHAKIVGRLKGLEEYKKELMAVAYNYPNIDEGKKADAIVKTEIPELEKLNFGTVKPVSWKIIFPIPYPNDKDPKVKALTDKIQKYLKDRNSEKVFLSNDVYTMTQNFLVIHGFLTKESASSTLYILQEYKDYKIKEAGTVISNEDYKVVQMKKNFEQYPQNVK